MRHLFHTLYQFLVITTVCLVICACERPVPEPQAVESRELPDVNRGDVDWLDPDKPETWVDNGMPYLVFSVSRRSYWSHEMSSICFSEPEIVREISVLTRPVWVDADLRPDLVDRFSLGGLPSLAVLTPDLRWVTGGTYLDREDVSALLRRVRILYDIPDRQVDLERERGRLIKRRPHPRPFTGSASELRAVLLRRIGDSQVIDRSGEAQIFLAESGQPDAGGQWLKAHTDSRLVNSDGLYVSRLLSNDGLIRDEVTSTGHNAGLLYTMAWLADRFGDIESKEKVVGFAGRLISTIYDHKRSMFHSGTADFSYSDALDILLPITADPPLTDRRTLTGVNAVMVSALCRVMALPDTDPQFAEVASKTLDRLLDERVRDDIVYRSDALGEPIIEDAAHLIRACLDYAEASGVERYRIRAEELAVRARRQFDSLFEPGQGKEVAVGADGDYGSAAGVFMHSVARLGMIDQVFGAGASLRFLKSTINRDIERVSKLGAAGRALTLIIPN